MKYLANLCFAGSRGKRNKSSKNDQNITVCCIKLYRNISKAIGKSTISQYSLLHRNIMDATKGIFVSQYKTISVSRGILQYNGVYHGITNAGGEESISRYNSFVSQYKSLNLKRSYIVIQGGVSQYKAMELK